MKNKVLSFDPTSEGVTRPAFLSVKQFGTALVDNLIRNKADPAHSLNIKE